MLRFLGMHRSLGLFLLLTLTGSIAFGWVHKPLWLIVPPLVLTAAAFRASFYTASRMSESGIPRTEFWHGVTLPNIMFSFLNTIYNIVVFFIAWLVASWI